MTKIRYHFLDSGAYSLKSKMMKGHISKKEFYDSKEFWSYIDSYAAFIKKYKEAIHFYANLDAIGDPDISWRNQQYLEREHKLKPVPVIHFGTDLKWIRFYIERYKLIGFGGLVVYSRHHSKKWLDSCFDIICDTPDRFPKIRVHGFGVTGLRWLLRYPWWSVDSTSWARTAGLGKIYIPKKKNGCFSFSSQPLILPISNENPNLKQGHSHFGSLSKTEKKIVLEWLDLISIPLGSEKEKGVRNNSGCRRRANLYFFDRMVKELSENPKPFHIPKRGLLV